MNLLPRFRNAVLVSLSLIALAACSSGNNDDRLAPIAPNSGFLTVALTDAPVDDAVEVIVVFTGIELQRSGGSSISIDFDTPRSIDLLSFREGRTTNLVEGTSLLPGDYEWIRLRVRAEENLQNGSRIRLRDGRQFPLYIPSGLESGLKLNRRFRVAQGATTRLLIDFDLRKSVIAPPGQGPNWILRPALRLVDQLEVGNLTVTVDIAGLSTAQQLTSSQCRAGLYVYRGLDITPDDMDGDPADGVDPVAYQPLSPTTPATTVNYTVHFLESGDYTVAATCQFDVDVDPSRSEYDPTATVAPGTLPSMRFLRKNVRILTGTTTRTDFP
jgi:hypothetical protein